MCNLFQVVGCCGHVVAASFLPCQERVIHTGPSSNVFSPILCPACETNRALYLSHQATIPIAHGAAMQSAPVLPSQPFFYPPNAPFLPPQQISQPHSNLPPYPPAATPHQPYYPAPQHVPPFTPVGRTQRPSFTTPALYHLATRTTVPLSHDLPIGILPPPGFLHAAIPNVHLQPQQIPGPGSNGAPLPVPEGAIIEVRDGVTHYVCPGNDTGRGRAQQQGFSVYYGHDSGPLPPGWGADVPSDVGGGSGGDSGGGSNSLPDGTVVTGDAGGNTASSTSPNTVIATVTGNAPVSQPSDPIVVPVPPPTTLEPRSSPNTFTPNTGSDTDIGGSRVEEGTRDRASTHPDTDIRAARIVRFASHVTSAPTPASAPAPAPASASAPASALVE